MSLKDEEIELLREQNKLLKMQLDLLQNNEETKSKKKRDVDDEKEQKKTTGLIILLMFIVFIICVVVVFVVCAAIELFRIYAIERIYIKGLDILAEKFDKMNNKFFNRI